MRYFLSASVMLGIILMPLPLLSKAATESFSCDVCVVGGGSGGFGQPGTAPRAGCSWWKESRLGAVLPPLFPIGNRGGIYAEEVYNRLVQEVNAVSAPASTYLAEEPYCLCLGDSRFPMRIPCNGPENQPTNGVVWSCA